MKHNLVRFIALMLTLVMLVGVFAACDKKDGDGNSTTNGGNTTTAPNGDDPDNPGGLGNDKFSGHPLGHFEDDGKTYTYHSWAAQFPAAWNVQTYESNDATTILNYTSDSLYTYDFTADYSTFQIVPSMASDYATDVTSQYVGKYGIEEGDVNKAWSIPLKDGLTFDNGDPIDANTFVESIQLLLNPKAQNGRADDFYMGSFKPYNAEQYLKQGYYAEDTAMLADEDMGNLEKYIDPSQFTTDADGYYMYNDKYIVMNTTNSGAWGGNSDWADYGFDDSIPQWKLLLDAASAVHVVRLNAELLKAFQDCIAMLHDFENVEAYAAAAGDYAYVEFEEACWYGILYPEVAWEDVGVFAPSAKELVIVIKDPMEDNYYLRSALASSFFLVNPTLYKSCIDESTGVYTNTYGTSVETYSGFGPYKLVEFVEGSYAKFDRNTNWHGYRDGEYLANTYQTDSVRIQLIEGEGNTDTAHEMFLKGELDGFGLSADYVNDYISSEYTYFTDSESTWMLVMNPSKSNFERTQATAEPMLATDNTVNKTVMTIPEFRQALSYSIDRQEFTLNTVATMKPAAYLLSKVLVADPVTMTPYRDYTAAKDAVLSFWGLSDEWGEGKEYADRDEAIDSITGYDPEGAKALFDTAYDKAVEQGLLTADQIASGKWEVQILAGLPNESPVYTNGGEYLQSAWTNATEGTKFEGHLSVKLSEPLGGTWYDFLKSSGDIDLLFLVGWGGDPMDPYGLFGCTVDPELQYDTFTDKKGITYDVVLDGKTLRASYYAWIHDCLGGTEIEAQVIGADGNPTGETVKVRAGTNDPVETRVAITAAGEEAVMELSNVFPLCTDATAALRGMRIKFVTDIYNFMVGFGGIEWNTYLMDDTEYANYVQEQGGTLNYK